MSETYNIVKPGFFEIENTAKDSSELFPEVWKSLELLISPCINDRMIGIDQIIALKAHRLSTIVAHTLATSLDDEDINFRFKVVEALGGLFSLDDARLKTPIEIKNHLKNFFGKMKQRRIYSLLEVAEYFPEAELSVALILEICPNSGGALSGIFTDYKLPIDIRRLAIHFAGHVGFLETIPRLEKLALKIESQMDGQRTIPFAQQTGSEESGLLPTIHSALKLLNSP